MQIKKLISLICVSAIIAILLNAIPAYATGVTYDAKTQKFIYNNDTSYTATDLFENFKSCMPGDVLEQEITVKNLPADGKKVQLLMRSVGGKDENSDDLLNMLTLTVEQTNGKAVYSQSTAQSAGNLKDWVDLGTYTEEKNITIKVKLEIPITLGNEYQNLGDEVHHIVWELKAIETEPEQPQQEDTGDALPIAMALTLACAAITLVSFAAAKKRTEK